MPSRQFHGKSRHGCKTCKKRKVRCDLGRPICANCTRLARECVWSEQLSPPASGQASAAQLIQPPAPHSVDSPESWTPNMLDLELMHHFTAFTALGMTDIPAHHHLWTAVVPRLAFQYPFLLHGTLALAALHKRTLATEFQQSTLLEVARDHQQQALSQYIPLLTDINDDNCHALFAFSQIIAAVSYALLQLSKGRNSAREFIKGIIAAFDLLLGATAIAYEGTEALRRGELAPMMGHGPSLLDGNMIPLSSEPKGPLTSLVHRVKNFEPSHTDDGYEEAEAAEWLVEAVKKLTPLFPRLPQTAPRMSTTIGWPVFMDAGYIAMLKKEEDAALVVLAYYGVTLHKLEHVWWLAGLGASLVHAVSEIVSDEWAPYLIWPKSEVFSGGVNLVV